MPNNIIDMYRPFERYVSSYFPNAIHIVDSFHVIQLIIRHILGYIRRRQRDIDERDRARHERIEQDIHRRFEFHHSRDYYIVKIITGSLPRTIQISNTSRSLTMTIGWAAT